MKFSTFAVSTLGVVAAASAGVLAQEEQVKPTLTQALIGLMEPISQVCLTPGPTAAPTPAPTEEEEIEIIPRPGNRRQLRRRLVDYITAQAAGTCAAAYPGASDAFDTLAECFASNDEEDDEGGEGGEEPEEEGGEEPEAEEGEDDDDLLTQITPALISYVTGPQASADIRDVFGHDAIKYIVETFVLDCLFGGAEDINAVLAALQEPLEEGEEPIALPAEVLVLFTKGDALTDNDVGTAVAKLMAFVNMMMNPPAAPTASPTEAPTEEEITRRLSEPMGASKSRKLLSKITSIRHLQSSEYEGNFLGGLLENNACFHNTKTPFGALSMLGEEQCPCDAFAAHEVDSQVPSFDEVILNVVVHPDLKDVFAGLVNLLLNVFKVVAAEVPEMKVETCAGVKEMLESEKNPLLSLVDAPEACNGLLEGESNAFIDMVLDLVLGAGENYGPVTGCTDLGEFPCGEEHNLFPLIPAATFTDYKALFGRFKQLLTVSGRDALYGTPVEDMITGLGRECGLIQDEEGPDNENENEDNAAVGAHGSLAVGVALTAVVSAIMSGN